MIYNIVIYFVLWGIAIASLFNENNGFFDKTKMKGDFLAYFKGLADRKNIKVEQ